MKVTFNINEEKKGLELRFDTKPAGRILKPIKKLGFHYNGSNPNDKFWYHGNYSWDVEHSAFDFFKSIDAEITGSIFNQPEKKVPVKRVRAPKRIVKMDDPMLSPLADSGQPTKEELAVGYSLFKGLAIRVLINSEGKPEFSAFDVAHVLFPGANHETLTNIINKFCSANGAEFYRINGETEMFISDMNEIDLLFNVRPDLRHPFQNWVTENFPAQKQDEQPGLLLPEKLDEQPVIIPDELPVETTAPDPSDLQVFDYHGSKITFQLGNGDVMVNATEMARPFKKEIKHFLEDKSRNEIVQLLCMRKSLNINDVEISTTLTISELAKLYPESIKVVKGGTPGRGQQGTWMHEDPAIEFARWLAPEFAIWCNDKIKELLKKGTVSLKLPQTYLEALEALVAQVKLTDKAENKVKELAPAAELGNAVKASEKSISMNELAKLAAKNGADVGERRLFQWMRDNGYVCKRDGISNTPIQTEITAGFMETAYVHPQYSQKTVPVAMIKPRGIAKYLPLIIAAFPKMKKWINDNHPTLF